MKRSALVLFSVVAIAAGCSDEPAPSLASAEDAAPPPGAGELETTSEDCAPGSRPAVGSATCVPVGPGACGEGFEKDASGWGCAPVLPVGACTGATRPALGSRACVPVGDCDAAFPPAGAIVVDPALADGAVDATHVRTLADAVAAAGDGAVVALADGTHEAATLTLSKKITLAGRCPAKAKLVPAPGATTGLRIFTEVTVRGVTFEGVDTPLEPYGLPASLVAEDVVIEGARARAVFAQRKAKAALRRVVVRGTVARSPGEQTIAVLVGTAADLTMEDSAVLDSFDAAVAGADVAETRIALTRTVIDGSTAGAVRAFEGAHVDLVDSAILRAGGVAVLALHRKGGYPEVTLTRSVIGDTRVTTSTGDELATAVNAAYGAIVKLEDATVADTRGIGVYSAETAKITLSNSAVVRVSENAQSSGWGATASHGGEIALASSAVIDATALGAGAFDGGKVTLDRSLVRAIGGASSEDFSLGFGLNATGASSIAATDSAIVDAAELGAASSGDGTRIDLDRVVMTKTAAARPAQFGHGVLAAYGSSIVVSSSIVERQTGVGLFYAAGGGSVSRSLVRANAIGAHVQEGSSLLEADAPPEAPPELELVITKDVRFVENATRTGSGELPLPKGLAAPP